MNKNILKFDEWAILNKDLGMEIGHSKSVAHMLKIIFSQKEKSLMNYNVLDLGCGNGWVVRKLKEHSLCKEAHGIDGAKQMIKKAQAKDSDGTYFNHDILTWDNKTKYDIVFSMEVLYYFENPQLILNKIYNQILLS